MPRRLRVATAGLAYHVLNRAAGGAKLFEHEGDYLAFERILLRTFKLRPVRIVTYCLMPTHWHMVLWPDRDDQLSEFVRLLSVTHAQRLHAHRHSAGTGPVYQGRFKSFPVQQDEHFLTVCRYVERNPVRANLVKSSARWLWSGLAKRSVPGSTAWLLPLEGWPVDVPRDWAAWVNRPETVGELEAIRESIKRGRPLGDERWQERTATKLKLESTLRPRGRQRLHPIDELRK